MLRRLKGWRPSITTVLLVGFGGLVAAPVVGSNLLTLIALQKNTNELLNDFAITSLTSITLQVDRTFDYAKRQSSFVAEQIRDRTIDPENPEQIELLLRGALSGTPQVVGLGYFGPNGLAVRVGRIGEQDGIGTILDDWRDEPNIVDFIRGLEAGAFTNSRTAVYVPSLDEPAVSVETAVGAPGEPFQGVVASVVGTRSLSEFLGELSEQYEGTAFILQGRDQVIAHPNMAGAIPPLTLEKPLPLRKEVGDYVMAVLDDDNIFREELEDLFPDGEARGQFIQFDGPDGEIRKVVITQELSGFDPVPWTVGIYFDADTVSDQVNRLFGASILIIVAVVMVSGVGWLLGRGIARPIRRFAKTAEAVEVMDFSDVPPAKRSLLKEIDETALRFDAMVTTLKRLETYVPKPLVRRLMQMDDARLKPETRQVTILFTDIEGFTAFSEGADANVVADFLNGHFAQIDTAIAAHRGTVDKFIGDSVMAFWGALDDDPEQTRHAVAAALDIRKAIKASTPDLRLRIGIHTGRVVAGAIGSEGRVNYTIVGDAVNVAQRLEGLGREHAHESGVTIVVSAEVAAGAPEGVVPEPAGQAILKGRDAAIEIYTV